MARRALLSETWWNQATAIPDDEREIAKHYTLDQPDLDLIMRQNRASNRLGLACVLAVLRFPGRPLADGEILPPGVSPGLDPSRASRSICRNCLMVSLLFAGITLSLFNTKERDARVADPGGSQTSDDGRVLIGMGAGFIPEWVPASNRNTPPV